MFFEDLFNLLCREWNRQAYDEYGMIRENASLVQAILRVFAFDYMLLAIPSVLAVSARYVSLVEIFSLECYN